MMKNIKRKHKLFKFQREKNLPIGGHYNARQTMEREGRTEQLPHLKKYIKIEVNKNFWNLKFSISETISKTVWLSALPSWLATRCPGETWWTATSTTTGWPGSTALSPASGATRTTSRATPDQRGFQSAESWRSTSPVDILWLRNIFFYKKYFIAGGGLGWSQPRMESVIGCVDRRKFLPGYIGGVKIRDSVFAN